MKVSKYLSSVVGYYIYTEASGRKTNDTARIISTNVNLMDNGKCVKFWYHMYGESIYKLNFYARSGTYNIEYIHATVNNISAISWRPVLVVEEAGVPGENH